MFREFQVPNYIFWSLEIHFYRREHQTVALSFLSTLLGLGNACSGAAGPSGGINSGGRSITSSSSTATTEPAGAQATGLFTRYLQDFIGTEYPDLDSFSEIMTPPTVATTQSCYVIGHLVRGKVSGMHMLLLILRELVLRVSDSHNAANGSFALLKNQPASSSEFLGQQHASADHVNVVEAAASNVVAGGRGPGANNSNINWRVELCAAVFPLLVKVLENHKANRILFLAEKGLELLCKSARQGFNLVKSDTSGVWGSALGGQAGSAKGKDSIADKHVLSTGALFLNSYFKLLLDFNAWFETLHEHTVYTDHYGSDDVGFPPEGGAKRGCSSTMTAAREGQHQHQALIGDHGDGGDLDLPQAPQSSSSEMAAPLGVPISSSRHQHPHHSGSMQLFPPIKLANARYHTRNSNGTGVASHNGLLQHPQQQHSSSSSSSHHPQQQHSSSSSHTAHHQHNKLLAALSNAPSTPPRNGRVASFDSTFCHVKNLFPSPLIDSPNGSPSPLKVWSDSSDDEEALRSYLPGKAVASKVTAPSHHNRAGAFHSSKRTKKLAQMARQPDVHDLPNLMMSPTDKKIKDALNNFMGDHDGEELLHAVDYSSCNAGAVGVTSTTDEPPMAAMSPTAELLDDLKKQRQIDALVHISQFRDQRSLSRRFQDRLRRLPGGARFIYETLQVYLISLVQHENKFLHQLLTVLAMILDGNRKNCKHFVEKYAGLNLLISVFSLYKDYVEGGTQDGMRGDEEGHPFHAPQKSLEEIVAARPDAIPFLQSNFLNFAIVCEAMPIRTQNLLLQPLNAYLDISERQSGEIKMLPPSRKQHSKTGGPKAAQQLQVYQQTNRSSQTRLQFLLNFIDDFYFSPAIQGMSCHFLVKFLYGRPFVQQSDPANLDVAVAPATAPTVDLIDVYGGEIRRKRKAALARGGNQRDGDGNLPVGLGGCIPTSRAFNGNEEEVDLAMASAMKSISPDTRRRLFSYLLDLFLTNVDNFPNDFAVVGHALHAAKLLLDADEEFRVTCTDSIELAKESAFNLPANERLQTRMLEMALPVLLRHIGHKHTGPMSKGAPGASSSRGMVEATKGGGGGGEQLYPRGAQSRSNTAIEYGLELVLLCPLERTIKAAKLLDIHLPTVLSNIIRENCVDVRLLFQVEKMHRRIETRFEKERKADFVKHKQTRWSKLAEYCEEEDAEMLSLVKDLVRADEQLFAAASSGASDQTRNAGDQGRKGSGYDDPKAAQAPKVIDESRKLRGRMASFDLEL
ncbi:unnamed protein product [Amoebophrya sp. A25]|nr:unnamed protein product [Amoebophrya sp. A25]|eukprot:GSA25T00014502001.1